MLRATVQFEDRSGAKVWGRICILDDAPVVHPAPSDLVVEYGSMIVLSTGQYLYAREKPEELRRDR